MSQRLSFLMSQKVNLIMSQKLSFLLSHKQNILMLQKVNFLMSVAKVEFEQATCHK